MSGSIERHAFANRGCAEGRDCARQCETNCCVGNPVSLGFLELSALLATG